jgi:hypothetical protein
VDNKFKQSSSMQFFLYLLRHKKVFYLEHRKKEKWLIRAFKAGLASLSMVQITYIERCYRSLLASIERQL